MLPYTLPSNPDASGVGIEGVWYGCSQEPVGTRLAKPFPNFSTTQPGGFPPGFDPGRGRRPRRSAWVSTFFAWKPRRTGARKTARKTLSHCGGTAWEVRPACRQDCRAKKRKRPRRLPGAFSGGPPGAIATYRN